MTNIVRRTLRKGKRILMLEKKPQISTEGNQYYSTQNAKNAGFQKYYAQNREEIAKGIVPERYNRIADVVPGEKIIEIGSADGTQSLTLARNSKTVLGVELMPMQFEEANRLKQTWKENGFDVDSCRFVNDNIVENPQLLQGHETVLMSRVLYHMRNAIDGVIEDIVKSDVQNVVLVGCPLREARWHEGGESGDSLGKYAYFASSEGMREVLENAGFEIVYAESSATDVDPLVVGRRSKVA